MQPADQLAVLFDELHRPLHRYLLCLGLAGSDADETVQETFLRLHRHLGNDGGRGNLRGWVFQVARNLALNQFKSAGRRLMQTLDDNHASHLADPRETPEILALRREQKRELRAAIERLTPHQRECLLLRAGGLRYREIAEVMGLGISNVAELVERATTRLQKELK